MKFICTGTGVYLAISLFLCIRAPIVSSLSIGLSPCHCPFVHLPPALCGRNLHLGSRLCRLVGCLLIKFAHHCIINYYATPNRREGAVHAAWGNPLEPPYLSVLSLFSRCIFFLFICIFCPFHYRCLDCNYMRFPWRPHRMNVSPWGARELAPMRAPYGARAHTHTL